MERNTAAGRRGGPGGGGRSDGPGGQGGGRFQFAFIHGNRCLANARRDGRGCAVDPTRADAEHRPVRADRGAG